MARLPAQKVSDVLNKRLGIDLLSGKTQPMTAQAAPEAFEQEGLEEELQESFDEKRRKKSPKRAEVEPANVASISDTGDLRAVDYLNLPAPEIVDPRSMSDEERRREQARLAQQGRQYREDISPEVDPKSGERRSFAERYKATTEMEERERGSSLERANLVAQLAGYDYEDDSGQIRRARGEDEERYKKHYFEAQEDAPWAREEDLQDAAILGVMEERARYAEEAAKSFDPEEIEATEDVGADLKVAELPTEEDLAKKAAESPSLRVSRGGKKTPTPQEVAARNALQEDVQGFLDEKAPVEDRPSPELPEGWEYDEDSGVSETELSALTDRERKAGAASRVLPNSESSPAEQDEWSRYAPKVKEEAIKSVVTPMGGAIDYVYQNEDEPKAASRALKSYLSLSLGGDPRSPAISLEGQKARSPYQYYKTLPQSVKRKLDEEMLQAVEFFEKHNRERGWKFAHEGTFITDPQHREKQKLRLKEMQDDLAGYKNILLQRMESGDYEDATTLPGKVTEGSYIPGLAQVFGKPFNRPKQVYTEESSFEDLIKEAEAQESYVEPQEDSSFEDLIKELERSSKRTESVL